ncbi:CHAT domain-containing protein [Apiospora phragmitis]|uniref:CHAT domain-containing protein n=1 Tax=Apiospora phragmitis TaxID=2905665 RepID=A0ABR1UZQ7_9PEZI
METSTYRGIHTSLYYTLPADAIQHIEKAIWLKITGRTDEARALYQNELSRFRDIPVMGEAWRILDKGLVDAKESNQDLDLPEYRLMALTRAMLGTRHRGEIVASADEVARTQSWLLNVPIEGYTDIQLYSAYENSEAELIPTCASSDSWSGLHELRRSLCARGMMKEANAVFRVELNRTPIEDREPVVEEFLSVLAGVLEARDRSYFEAIVRLQWANTLVMLQNVCRALEEMDRSEAAFNAFCDLYDIIDRASTPHMQSLEYEKLSCIQDPVEKLRKTEFLAGRFEKMEGSKAGSCLSDAADLANLFFKFTSDPAFQDKYFDLQARLEIYDETVSQDIADLVQHRNSLISVTLSTTVDRQQSLEWIDGFLQRHSYFTAPAILASLYKSQAMLFRSLRRMHEASEADKKVAELDTCGPSSIGGWAHYRSAPAVLPSHDPDSATREEPNDEVIDEQFFWPWRNWMRGETQTDTTTVDILWEWSLDDVAAGRLAAQDFRAMMGITDPDIKFDVSPRGVAEIAKAVGSERVDELASLIYPKSPEVTASQEAQYERICKWLMSEPPKGLREKRLFCLVMLRESRQAHFAQQNMLDRRLRELRQLLELDKILPSIIRETFPRNRASWVGAMSMTLVAQLAPVADFTGDAPSRTLLEAERWNEDALEEHLHVNDRVSYAVFQRVGAQICLMKIFRLQQLARSPGTMPESTAATTEEIKTLQAIGIRKVEESDAILSRKEINASWSDGLDSVAHRQDLTRFYGSAFTAIAAITLYLSHKEDLSTDAAGNIWSWVQKYKARSLARTIGVRSYDPPELINSIMQSTETRAMYEEMLSLKERTEDADLMARFGLHRKMDAHLERMKSTHPLLRQLVDLREATPFATSDISALEAQAGSSVVLLDWFYLPPYIANQTGQMLLFTARADMAPTMDVVPVTEADVLAWQEQHLSPPTWTRFREEKLAMPEARSKFDAMLGGLVAPLAHRTKRGEVLVLCPSSTLHRVPLHALTLTTTTTATAAKEDDGSSTFTNTATRTFEEEALIHRNPVVYTHSHSLLRSCAAAAEHARHTPRALRALFLSGIPEEAEATGYAAGRASVRDLAGGFDVLPMMDAGASKPKFLEGAVGSRLIHLHTHCNWRAGDPLNHHVEFPRVVGSTTDANREERPRLGPEDDGTNNDDEDDRPVDRLTARELFEVRLPPSTHVNMIACQGGVADVQLGDEVMGLVPALLYAGASSTVSTLWSIDDKDGAAFSRHFVDSFLRQCRKKKKKTRSGSSDTAVGFVDVAKAVRAAVGEMDATMEEPLYRWAAFVFHGFWQIPLSSTDMERLQANRP